MTLHEVAVFFIHVVKSKYNSALMNSSCSFLTTVLTDTAQVSRLCGLY